MKNTVLLVVDIQNALINFRPYRETEFLENTRRLINAARQSGMEVIFVRHDSGAGSPLAFGSEGWQIYSEVAPLEGERIFDKSTSSAFRGTGLCDYLRSKGITDIILVGMQTDFCIDTTCRVGFEYGFNITIPVGGTTTFDNSLATADKLVEYFENTFWNNRFAEVRPLEEVLVKITEI